MSSKSVRKNSSFFLQYFWYNLQNQSSGTVMDTWFVWTLRSSFLFINNLYIWRLMNMNCYLPKESLLFPLKFTIMSLVCTIGLWLASTRVSKRFPRITSIALVPTFVVTPFMVTMDYWIATIVAIAAGIIGLYRCWGEKHVEMASESHGRS